MIKICDGPIDHQELFQKLDITDSGSAVFHLGVSKSDPEGKKSEGVEFTRDGDPEGELEEIEKELRERFQLLDVVLAKRAGRVEVGQLILFAAVSAKDRVNSFGACQAAVEACKKIKGLKKRELLVE